jgi:acyl-CoA thioesterase-1
MKKILITFLSLLIISLISCGADDNDPKIIFDDEVIIIGDNYNILSLGDSYTIGQSVCETCRFPEQLKSQLENYFIPEDVFSLQIIAQTGWTTSSLLNALNSQNPSSNFDLVTLLIGVNNQYQNRPFSLYENEFPMLVEKAIEKGKGDKSNVIVISIPDYAYTPAGQNNPSISEEIDEYNEFAKNYCENNNIAFINITDITRNGLDNPDLVASDNLHPSALAYELFVERILPVAIQKLND